MSRDKLLLAELKKLTCEMFRADLLAGGDESADALANIRKAIGAAFLSELNAKALGSLADELDAAAKGFRRLGAASELKRATEGQSSR